MYTDEEDGEKYTNLLIAIAIIAVIDLPKFNLFENNNKKNTYAKRWNGKVEL